MQIPFELRCFGVMHALKHFLQEMSM